MRNEWGRYYKTTPGIGSPAKEQLNENRTLTIELREQCLGLLQVLGVEAFGEPVDLGEHRTRLIATTLRCEQTRETHVVRSS